MYITVLSCKDGSAGQQKMFSSSSVFISSVRWHRVFTDMHCNAAAHWSRIDMDFEDEKYEQNR